jgi:hypothetical protein
MCKGRNRTTISQHLATTDIVDVVGKNIVVIQTECIFGMPREIFAD